VPKLKEIYGKKAPDYARRSKARGQILRQMRDEAEATGLDKKLDATLDDVVALEDQDDLDRSIAERTAKNKNFPALVDDAQRAKAWQRVSAATVPATSVLGPGRDSFAFLGGEERPAPAALGPQLRSASAIREPKNGRTEPAVV
jgi:hypothetical protein